MTLRVTSFAPGQHGVYTENGELGPDAPFDPGPGPAMALVRLEHPMSEEGAWLRVSMAPNGRLRLEVPGHRPRYSRVVPTGRWVTVRVDTALGRFTATVQRGEPRGSAMRFAYRRRQVARRRRGRR